jgi:hypothetical protein
MTRILKSRIVLLGLVGLALAGCGDGKEIERISEKMGLNESEQYAFMICNRDMKVKLPAVEIAGVMNRMTRMPLEICGCHSKAMAEVFKGNPGIKAGNVIFTSFAKKTKKGRMPKFPEELLNKGVTEESAITKLSASFNGCVTNYQTAFKAQSVDLFAPIVKKEKKGHGDDKKKDEKTAAKKDEKPAESSAQ